MTVAHDFADFCKQTRQADEAKAQANVGRRKTLEEFRQQAESQRQRLLLDGMDCLPGQRELFEEE